jgi:hypothetical protein
MHQADTTRSNSNIDAVIATLPVNGIEYRQYGCGLRVLPFMRQR